MKATLRLRLTKDLGGASVSDGAVTQVYAIDPAGQRDPTRDRRDLVIPAGYDASRLELQLEPGDYRVEAVLPSGDVASEQVHLAEGGRRDLDLEPQHAPHEWLSWQQYLGNVPAKREIRRLQRKARPTATRDHRIPDTQVERIDGFAKGVRDAGPLSVGTAAAEATRPRRAARRPDWPTIWFIDTPVEALRGGTPPAGDAWAVLADASAQPDPLATLSGGQPIRVPLDKRDLDRELLMLGAGGPLGPNGSGPGGPEIPRRYLLTEQRRGPVEIACLPVPWETAPYGSVPLEVLVRRHPLAGEAVLAMSPRDPNIGPALGYMATGSLGNARVIVNRAMSLLFEKRVNPIAAAAGAYVLLATDRRGEDQSWHDWIRNLSSWFPWVPDGAILRGRLRMQHRRGRADVAAARLAFFEAYDRGIPFFSMGLQWLVDGLTLLATRDEEARRRLASVQRVVWRANLQQPFTTIRLRDQ